MQVNLMVEGQEGVGWPQWRALAAACEEHGLSGLFRSDHYQSLHSPGDHDALDAWATIAAVGPLTSRIRLGTVVSPASFRHPSVLAKSVVTADHASQGRVELGLGAGWHEAEHVSYGFHFPEVAVRFEMLAEQIEIIVRQFRGERFDFCGKHYSLSGCAARPVPFQAHLPIIVGGSAGPRSVGIAVRWADEYNIVLARVSTIREVRERLDRASDQVRRLPLSLSLTTVCVLGHDESDVRDRLRVLAVRLGRIQPLDALLREVGDRWVVGTVEQAAERLAAMGKAGLDRVMLQHLCHDDLDMVGLVGRLAT